MNDILDFNLNNNTIFCAYDAIEKWIKSKELSSLVKAFDGSIPNDLNLKDAIFWLLAFSDIWDYRNKQAAVHDTVTGEKARWLITDQEISAKQKQCVFDVISNIGLINRIKPSKKNYDYVIVLGGAKLSCLLRSKYAAKIINDSVINTSNIVFLATERPISESEREATDLYAKEANTEFDLINAGALSSFNLENISKTESLSKKNSNLNYRIYNYKDIDNNIPAIVISAPSKESDIRRANTADTYEFFISKYNVLPKSSFLVVTSQIYVPYQQLEALRTIGIPHDISIDTIGYIINEDDKNLVSYNAANYLQEIRSTIQSIARFIEKYPIK